MEDHDDFGGAAVPFDVNAALKELENEAAVSQQWKPSRSTKLQRGTIQLFTPSQQQQHQHQGNNRNNRGREELVSIAVCRNTVSLGQKLSVVWNLPEVPREVPKKSAEEVDFFGTGRGAYSSTGSSSVGRELTIGLYRLGSLTNDKAVVTKTLHKISRSKDGGGVTLHGNIDFYAPKMPGVHVFRLFDSASNDRAVETLATSVPVVVTAVDGDWGTALTRLREAVDEDKTGLALSMLQGIADYGRYSGVVPMNSPMRADHAKLLGSVVEKLLGSLEGPVMANTERLTTLIDDAEHAKAEAGDAVDAADASTEAVGDKPPAADRSSAKEGEESATAEATAKLPAGSLSASALKDAYMHLTHTVKLHNEGYDAFSALLGNRHAMEQLHMHDVVQVQQHIVRVQQPRQHEMGEAQAPAPVPVAQRLSEFTQQCYSRVLRRFYRTPSAKTAAEKAKLTFVPCPPSPKLLNFTSADQMGLLERHIMQKCFLQVAQTPATEAAKEALCHRLQGLLREKGVIGPDVRLAIFGSSMNGFGLDSSDVDMSLVYDSSSSSNHAVTTGASREPDTAEARAEVITKIGECLAEEADVEVKQVRSTARVPIVHFVTTLRVPVTDASGNVTSTGSRMVECDIACPNPLALRNTALLRLYGEVDPRVRPLAFAVKHWMKARGISDPGKGTLSTYGYMLLLIHYLQQQKQQQHQRDGAETSVIIAPVLPNLQQLGRVPPPAPQFQVPREHLQQWQQQSAAYAEQQARNTLRHPLDGMVCDTYFFQPTNPQQLHWMRTAATATAASAAAANKGPGQSAGGSGGGGAGSNVAPNNTPLVLLLLGFFRYYAYEFDYFHHVVTINPPGNWAGTAATATTSYAGGPVPVLKADWAEKYCWRMQTDRFGIADPFEPWYDVAHVIKPGKMTLMRNEFIRAYTILVRALCDLPQELRQSEQGLPPQPRKENADEAAVGGTGDSHSNPSDSLQLADVIHSCIATTAELVQLRMSMSMSMGPNGPPVGAPPPNPTAVGASVDPNYLAYPEMLLDLLCDPVAEPTTEQPAATPAAAP